MASGTTRYQPLLTRGTNGMMSAIPRLDRKKPARMIAAGRRSPAFLPATSAAANMVSDSGASDSPACRALYSSVIWKNSGRAIMAPPRVTCCSIWAVTPAVKFGCRNRSGSSRVTFCSRLRRTSHRASSTSATAPSAISRPTSSPPSCQTRIPSTTPPMPTTDRTAPTRSIWREPV